MSLVLGIDTGGTYTDAVLFDKKSGIKKSAKALTTKHDLTIGITNACNEVLTNINPNTIKMVSLSSTLATNAIVEKHFKPVCLIMIGFNKNALEKANLKSALGSDPCYFVSGGHKASGEIQNNLDEDSILNIIKQNKDKVSAFAVCSMFAVRNHEHETRTQELIEQNCSLPTTLSHSLASALDAPRRALTALLNARLISQIHQLINAVKNYLVKNNINAKLMIVQGNGSLMNCDIASKKPVETIMSGPAASIIGASYLTNNKNAIVADIGGTTTDVAMIKDGLPVLSDNGAVVHGWRTMVEAIDVYTVGLGGDSEVRNEAGQMIIGPIRTTPLALLAQKYPYIKDILQQQLRRDFRKEYDGRFAHRIRNIDSNIIKLSASEQYFWDELEDGAKSLEQLLKNRKPPKPLDRLVNIGLVIYSAFSCTDASHVLGLQNQWDKQASILGGKIYALKERVSGQDWAKDEVEFSNLVIKQMTLQSSQVIIASAYMSETGVNLLESNKKTTDFLNKIINEDEKNSFALNVEFSKPIIAIGAPAKIYYDKIAKRIGAELIIPKYSCCANAVGAVVGKIVKNINITISAPNDKKFRVHTNINKDFDDLELAVNFANEYGTNFVKEYVEQNNGCDFIAQIQRHDKIIKSNGKDMFIESIISVRGIGEPKY